MGVGGKESQDHLRRALSSPCLACRNQRKASVPEKKCFEDTVATQPNGMVEWTSGEAAGDVVGLLDRKKLEETVMFTKEAAAKTEEAALKATVALPLVKDGASVCCDHSAPNKPLGLLRPQ